MGNPGQRRVPRPARRRRAGPMGRWGASRRAVAVVLALAIALLTGALGRPPAARAVAADPVLGPWVDALVVGRAATAGEVPAAAGPRLLVVAPPDVHEPGTVHLVLLDRGPDVWSEAGRLDVPTGLAVAGAGELVALDGAVALVSTDEEVRRTSVTRLVVGADGPSATASTMLDIGSGGVGALDVDGDGIPELALIGESPADTAACRRSSLAVLDGHTLGLRTGLHPIRATLGAGSIGRFDGPGQSIAAVAIPNCETDPPALWRTGVVRLDPLTGDVRLVRDVTDLGGTAPQGPSRPLPIDVDGDGRDELVVRTAEGASILEPLRDWRSTALVDGAIPIAVAEAASGPPVLALYRPGSREDSGIGPRPTMDLRVVRRVGGTIALGVRSVAVRVGIGPDGTGPPAAVALAIDPVAPPPVWSGDLAGAGCTAITMPGVTFQGCGSSSAWTQRTGPAWLSTVPLAAYGPSRGRRLLVAAGLGWGIGNGTLAAPSPAASTLARAAGWRSGPSSPFALVELDASDVAYFTSFPAAAIDVDPNGGGRDTPELVLGGTAGDRVFARLVATDAQSSSAGPDPASEYVDDPTGHAAAAFLTVVPSDVPYRIGVIPVPPASTAGAHPGSIVVPLPLGPGTDAAGAGQGGPSPGPVASAAPDGTASAAVAGGPVSPLTAAWKVSAIGLNAYGMPSPIVTTLVAVDTTGPNVSIESPFVSAPWPFSASLRGRVEAGARVGLDGGPLADAAMNGSFELRTQLAPWPQTLTIRAVDEHGNVSTSTLEVVGGLDYRRLPWQSILVAGVLLGAAMTTWRGPTALRRTRDGTAGRSPGRGSWRTASPGAATERLPMPGRARPGRLASGGPAVEPVAEIEDLP